MLDLRPALQPDGDAPVRMIRDVFSPERLEADARAFDRAADFLAFVDPARHREAVQALRDRAERVRVVVAKHASQRWDVLPPEAP